MTTTIETATTPATTGSVVIVTTAAPQDAKFVTPQASVAIKEIRLDEIIRDLLKKQAEVASLKPSGFLGLRTSV